MVNQDKSVQLKLGLLKLAHEIGSVSKACAMMNFSRDSFYRFRSLYERGGEEALKNVSRKKPLLKNRVSGNVEDAVCRLALQHPGYGQQKASEALKAEKVIVSPSGIRSIWMRNDLETYPKRAQAIRTKVLYDGLVPTDEQSRAAHAHSPADGSFVIEAGGPGFLCFHGIKTIGNVNGIGPLFAQMFLDSFSRYAFVELCTSKNDQKALGFLESRVLPWFDAEGVAIGAIRSDRAMTFCGKGKPNPYQNNLKARGIRHSFRSSRGSAPGEPWTEFHRVMKNEFFRFALRARVSWTLNDLQHAADAWVADYNSARPNPLRFCYGKTPLQTFRDAKQVKHQEQRAHQAERSATT